MGSIEYRRSLESEVEQLFDVRTSVKENLLTRADLVRRGITPALYAGWLRSGEVISFSAVEEDRVLGFSGVRPADSEIFALFVHPDAEGRGLGARLLELAETTLIERGARVLKLETDPTSRAHAFYLRRGWVDVDRPAASPDDVAMEKALSPRS